MNKEAGINRSRELFDYFDEHSKRSIKSTIGTYITRNLPWIVNGSLVPPETVNSWDRMEMARDYISKRSYGNRYDYRSNYTSIRDYEESQLQDDIAVFIDRKIPQHYWTRVQEGIFGYRDRTYVRQDYRGINSVPGLRFVYPENYNSEFHR